MAEVANSSFCWTLLPVPGLHNLMDGQVFWQAALVTTLGFTCTMFNRSKEESLLRLAEIPWLIGTKPIDQQGDLSGWASDSKGGIFRGSTFWRKGV